MSFVLQAHVVNKTNLVLLTLTLDQMEVLTTLFSIAVLTGDTVNTETARLQIKHKLVLNPNRRQVDQLAIHERDLETNWRSGSRYTQHFRNAVHVFFRIESISLVHGKIIIKSKSRAKKIECYILKDSLLN